MERRGMRVQFEQLELERKVAHLVRALLRIRQLDDLNRDCLAGGLEHTSVHRPIRAPAELAGDAHVVVRMLQPVELTEPHSLMVAAKVHRCTSRGREERGNMRSGRCVPHRDRAAFSRGCDKASKAPTKEEDNKVACNK